MRIIKIRKIIRQSNVLIQSENISAINKAFNAIIHHRLLLEQYIRNFPSFQYSLDPVEVSSDAPEIVRIMASASRKAGVGPMAAVAGALADLAGRAMSACKAQVAVVENGGEIFATSTQPLTVAIYAGETPLSGKIGFYLQPEEFPVGIGTSSATISHALSFGEADVATIIAETASLADAAATAVCNAVKGEDIARSIQCGLQVAETIPHLKGALIIRGKYAGVVGRLPQLIRIVEGKEAVKTSLKEFLTSNILLK